MSKEGGREPVAAFRSPQELLDRARAAATREGLSFSEFVRQGLEARIARDKKERAA